MRHDSFIDWDEEAVLAFLAENSYCMPRQLEDGDWIGIQELMFTTSVCMGITPTSPFTYRWCFEDEVEAMQFLLNAREVDEIPTHRSSLRGHRYLSKPLLIEKDERGFDKW